LMVVVCAVAQAWVAATSASRRALRAAASAMAQQLTCLLLKVQNAIWILCLRGENAQRRCRPICVGHAFSLCIE
jgi:hypothetical protein